MANILELLGSYADESSTLAEIRDHMKVVLEAVHYGEICQTLEIAVDLPRTEAATEHDNADMRVILAAMEHAQGK